MGSPAEKPYSIRLDVEVPVGRERDDGGSDLPDSDGFARGETQYPRDRHPPITVCRMGIPFNGLECKKWSLLHRLQHVSAPFIPHPWRPKELIFRSGESGSTRSQGRAMVWRYFRCD